jgi:hypothetical protein
MTRSLLIPTLALLGTLKTRAEATVYFDVTASSLGSN